MIIPTDKPIGGPKHKPITRLPKKIPNMIPKDVPIHIHRGIQLAGC